VFKILRRTQVIIFKSQDPTTQNHSFTSTYPQRTCNHKIWSRRSYIAKKQFMLIKWKTLFRWIRSFS